MTSSAPAEGSLEGSDELPTDENVAQPCPLGLEFCCTRVALLGR